MRIKKRIFEIIQTARPNDKVSKVFDISLIFLILLNVCLVIADTFSLPPRVQKISNWVENFSSIIFTIEYLLRIWTADLLYPQNKYFVAKIKYVFSLMAIIDLLAILPFYLPMLIPIDLKVLRMLRITRLIRVFKINRYTKAFSSIVRVFKKKRHELLSSVFIVFLLMIVASVLMYSIENPAQPEVFKNAFDALWWALATLTTVGYGDIYPITVLGRILGTIIALLGIALIAIPTGIISAGFIESMQEKKNETTDEFKYCPHCGKKLY